MLFLPTRGMALIEVVNGNRALDSHVVQQLPVGVEDVANLNARLGYWIGPPFGGGEYHFGFQCKSAEEFSRALNRFAAIRARRLELVVHDGKHTWTFDKAKRADWTLTVWHPASWHRLHSRPASSGLLRPDLYMRPVPAPRIDVYLGGGTIAWDAIDVPENIAVTDERVSAAPVEVVGGGLIRGTVYDMATGRVIGGAEVILVREEGRASSPTHFRATANDWGDYQIEKIAPPGRYEVQFRAEGYATRRHDYFLKGARQYDRIDVDLSKAASISGVVADAKGKPLARVTVSARDPLGIDGRDYPCSAKSATTDVKGRFEITALPRGYTRLRCSRKTLHQSSPFDLQEVPTDTVAIVMEGTGIVRGQVVAPGDKAPGSSVHIHIDSVDRKPGWGGGKRCEPDGTFLFEGVPPGRYRVSTQPLIEGIENTNFKTIEVKPGETSYVEVEDGRRRRARR
jgi:hypothetical protein